MKEYLADGYNVIWTHGSQFYEATAEAREAEPGRGVHRRVRREAAGRHAEQRLGHRPQLPRRVLPDRHAGRGPATKTGKIGYVGGLSLPFSDSEVHAMNQALKDAGSTAQIIPVWTGDFNDPAKAQQITSQLIEPGRRRDRRLAEPRHGRGLPGHQGQAGRLRVDHRQVHGQVAVRPGALRDLGLSTTSPSRSTTSSRRSRRASAPATTRSGSTPACRSRNRRTCRPRSRRRWRPSWPTSRAARSRSRRTSRRSSDAMGEGSRAAADGGGVRPRAGRAPSPADAGDPQVVRPRGGPQRRRLGVGHRGGPRAARRRRAGRPDPDERALRAVPARCRRGAARRRRRWTIRAPRDAIAAGVGMVHQNFLQVDSYTVAENIVLGT